MEGFQIVQNDQETKMKVYILKDSDLEHLTTEISRDPRFGKFGGSEMILSVDEEKLFKEAYMFYNYIVRRWIEEIKK